MDCFELRVSEAYLYQNWYLVLPMQEGLELTQSFGHYVGRRRNEDRLPEATAGRTDPVLAATEFARSQFSSSRPRHQLLMDLADQADRNRQVRESGAGTKEL